MLAAKHYNMAGNVAIGDEIYGLPHPHHHCHHQIMGLRVTEAQCQLHQQCHLDLIGLETPGFPTMANPIGS